MRIKPAVTPLPSHFKPSRQLNAKAVVALCIVGLLLSGALWYVVFRASGLLQKPNGDDAVDDFETKLARLLASGTESLALQKPCFLKASKKMYKIIKHGCSPRPEPGAASASSTEVDLPKKKQVSILRRKEDEEEARVQKSREESASALLRQANERLSKGKRVSPRPYLVPAAASASLSSSSFVHVRSPAGWQGPPLLNPWRNVASPRMRPGWKFASADNSGTIFVSLVSYRDDKCPISLKEMFEKARNPDKVFVGIVQQNQNGDVDCFETYCKEAGTGCRFDNIRVIRMAASEARGVMVVRHLATTMYEGEEYFMQIDAHNLFAQNWDARLIQDLQRASALRSRNPRIVLSHHPPSVDNMPGWSSSSAINICKYQWDGNGLPRFSAQVVTPPVVGEPFPGVFIGSGMVFARAELLVDCPFDKHLPFLFSGEELLLASCAFSHGWDIYNPSFAPVFHFYKNSNTMKVFNPTNDAEHTKSLKRLKYLLGVDGSFESLPEGEFRQDLTLYSMGSARLLSDYFEYGGIDWVSKKNSYPFCDMYHETGFYKYHNAYPAALPALSQLSFAKGIPHPYPSFPVVSGVDLRIQMK